jgi:hypothetical protein
MRVEQRRSSTHMQGHMAHFRFSLFTWLPIMQNKSWATKRIAWRSRRSLLRSHSSYLEKCYNNALREALGRVQIVGIIFAPLQNAEVQAPAKRLARAVAVNGGGVFNLEQKLVKIFGCDLEVAHDSQAVEFAGVFQNVVKVAERHVPVHCG